MKNLSLAKILSVYDILISENGKLTLQVGEIEFKFDTSEKKILVEKLVKDVGLEPETFNQTSFTIKAKVADFIFFDNLTSLLNTLNRDISMLSTTNIFVFDVDGYYLYFDKLKKTTVTNSKQLKYQFIISHFQQYKSLLDIYLNNEGGLFEMKKTTSNTDELVILSKGEQKLVTSVSYKSVDLAIFIDEFFILPVNEFETKITLEDWLACYNNTLCQFMEAQSLGRQTFSNLYNNFNYIINLTNKNYQLYILKFSFDKIRKQFKTEKNSYFENLNIAQDKISSQIISIPISLGASIYSFYQFDSSDLILKIVYIAILIYSLFIGFVVIINLYDVKKIAEDTKEEMKNFIKHYPDLFLELKSDFGYMKNKRIRVRILAWSIIISLIVTLICITLFLLNYSQTSKEVFFYL